MSNDDSDFYGGGDDGGAMGGDAQPDKPEEKADSNTALVPMPIFGDTEPKLVRSASSR